jgi:methylated-DNA-[protein]-cysteine S-methyltransferase
MTNDLTTWTRDVPSPIGTIRLVASDDALVRLVLPGERGPHPEPHDAPDHPVLGHAAAELDAWFEGTLRAFTVPLRASGTPFQHRVWDVLSTIPYGTTWSYADVAQRLGQPRAVRAVGAANGRNPLPIVVPCHRVIGRSGALTGFGGGLPAKVWLLDHERRSSGGRLAFA